MEAKTVAAAGTALAIQFSVAPEVGERSALAGTARA